jgi:hypothetical protein
MRVISSCSSLGVNLQAEFNYLEAEPANRLGLSPNLTAFFKALSKDATILAFLSTKNCGALYLLGEEAPEPGGLTTLLE